MRTTFAIAATLSLIAGANMSLGASKSELPIEKMVATERAFAATSLDSGMTIAFLKYLHDESVVFRPGPISGKRWYADRTNTNAVLNWRPEFAEISAAGDLGYSTGPWAFRSSPDDTTTYYGRFVTIWQRQPDGEYMVMADLGIDHEPIVGSIDSVAAKLSSLPAPAKPVNAPHDSLVAGLKAAEAAFSKASTENPLAKTLRSFGADGIRILRPDHSPSVGINSADSLVGASHLLIDTRFADVAASGDLGYTYGFFTNWPAGSAPTAGKINSFLRVWKKVGSDWKIALDIALPMKK